MPILGGSIDCLVTEPSTWVSDTVALWLPKSILKRRFNNNDERKREIRDK